MAHHFQNNNTIMTDFSQFDNDMSLANQKSGIADGNTNASVESLKHLLDAVNKLGEIVKQLANNTTVN